VFFSLTDYFFDKLHLSAAVDAIPFLPDMPADLAPLVLGPLLLLFTLTRHPGGFGDMLRPIGRWLREAPAVEEPAPLKVEAHA
jgi:hypothetical protein